MTKPAAQALLQEGLQLHQRGALDKAAQRYKRVLRSDPAHSDALELIVTLMLQQSRPGEALAYVEKAQTLSPENAAPHNLAGVVLMSGGKSTDALAAFKRAVALQPAFTKAWFNHALTANLLQRFDIALDSLDHVIALQPEHAAAHFHRGKALLALGRLEDAIAPLERALALKPDLTEAHHILGNVLLDLGRPEDALAHHQLAAELMPDRAEVQMNYANTLLALKRTHDAVRHYERALACKPDFADAHFNYANALHVLAQNDAAIRHYERAIALKPDFVDAHVNLAIVQLKLERPADAMPHLERALVLKPDYALTLEHLGNANRLLGRADEALANYDKAIAADPAYSKSLDAKAKFLIELGRLEEARDLIGKAIELEPRNASYLHTIAGLKRVTSGDPHFAAMEALACDIGALSPDAQLELHFALGKAYADDKQYERSFRHLLQANALKRREYDYDEAATLATHENCRTVFSPELCRGKLGGGDSSALPVFIVGMMRSGSTLIEQILASHPRVHGAGERSDFERAFRRVTAHHALPYPAVVQILTNDELRKLGVEYISSIKASSTSADHIVDKMLGNYLYLGLIHLALPNARIIHTRRDPIDTCLSCFSIRFTAAMPFVYDLGELGRYYRAYDALMAHWRQVLPPGVMLEVQYEDVVDDIEQQARRIVAHCGLEWDDACLAFHETERSVRTASAAQVRRPIYRSSVERWRPYKDQLQPLFDALGMPQN
jgi:tetratricopeptide (TPR) repeat protein